jgi:transcriptional regulator with XRE-family HTH domain
MKNIGPRIVALREERRISLSELARESGISKSLLHRIENQEGANPELGTLRKISSALNITVGELIGNEVVTSVRQLPDQRPEWLTKLTARLKQDGKEPDPDLLEALYVLQNRKGQTKAAEDDWLYIYQTLERSFNR